MKTSSYKATTALVASLSLAIPHATIAQTTVDPAQVEAFCGATDDAKLCSFTVSDAVENGFVELDENGALTGELAFSAGSLTLDGETYSVGTAVEAEVVSEAELPAAEAAKTAAEAESAAALEAQALAEAEALAAQQAQEESEAAAQTQAELQAAEATKLAAQAEAAAAIEAKELAEAEAIAAKQAQATAEAETAATIEAKIAAEAEQLAVTDAPVEVDKDEDLSEVGEAIEDTGAKVVQAPEAAPEEPVVQTDTADSTQAANSSLEVSASSPATGEETGEIVTEIVTAEDVRSSGQDFGNTATANTRSGGLNNLEKFLVGAAGIAVVGALLKNGDKVVSNSGDRVVVQREDGGLQVLKDDDVLLRRPGAEVQTQTFGDGSTRSIVTRQNGSQVVTIRSATGQVLRRTRILRDGREVVLFDDTREAEPVVVSELPSVTFQTDQDDVNQLRAALLARDQTAVMRSFTLQQIRQIRAVRELAPEVELRAVNFDTGSAAIRATEAQELSDLGNTIRRQIEDNPNEVFLIEGHTDAVGNAGYNLALSDRRAESVALALTEYFDVPPENMIVQGYGEANLKIVTPFSERQNRRAAVRRITGLLQTAQFK